MSETERIRDQLRRAFEGEAWHGPAVREILAGVTATRAAARPIPGAHSIWEIVLHILVWKQVVRRRLEGEIMADPPHEEDWPAVQALSEEAWRDTLHKLDGGQRALQETISELDEQRLTEIVPNKGYSIYFMLHGVIQHDLYHAGQIAVLKKADLPGRSA